MRLLVACIFAAALTVAGCKTTPPSTISTAPKGGTGDSATTEAELRERLSQFYVSFVNTIQASMERAGAKHSDAEGLRRITLIKIRLVRSCRATVFQENVLAAFLDTWALCVQMRVFLESDQVTDKSETASLHESVVRLQSEIESIGSGFLPPARLTELRDQLEKFARENPFGAERTLVPASKSIEHNLPAISWVLNLPLTPFRAMEGVDRTAAAISEFTKVADGIGRTVAGMPLELSWEVELLLLQLRRDTEAVLTDVDGKQKGLQSTLHEARATLGEVDDIIARTGPIIDSAQQTIGGIATAASGLDQLLRTYTGMVKELYPRSPADAPAPAETEPKGPPFDIRDYTRTVEGITAAAHELRGLIVELGVTLDSPMLERKFDRALATAKVAMTEAQRSADALLTDAERSAEAMLTDAQRSTEALLNAALLRGIALIVAGLVAALIYRRVSLHWSRGEHHHPQASIERPS